MEDANVLESWTRLEILAIEAGRLPGRTLPRFNVSPRVKVRLDDSGSKQSDPATDGNSLQHLEPKEFAGRGE